MGRTRVFTIDIIREQKGIYRNDKTNAYKSYNANFGKFLKAHSAKLGIKEIRSGVKVKDDFGNKTSSSEWEIL